MTSPWLPPTAKELNSAKGVELNHWITQINASAGNKKKILTKAGTVDACHQKIAGHLGIDLTLTPSLGPLVAPVGVDEVIGRAQWAWAHQLGQEWADNELPAIPSTCSQQLKQVCNFPLEIDTSRSLTDLFL